ncbi:LOW QUALITY PROTEIN: uncharacterized protein LOC135206784 [Macrobrachium nipponense]|uniref:LOW QUALITY PROTEIN: uncharacterized protein LOC135206784 n=1 Tax=Macrobrachium nipponense TaxID=159736 RepID=UPI0030C851D0
MSVVIELVRLGLLPKEAYIECLCKFVYKQEIDVKTCETLLTLIKAWDIDENHGLNEDESLYSAYAELLQNYLYPQLTLITGNVEAELPNHFNNFHALEGLKTCADAKSSSCKGISLNTPSLVKPNCKFEHQSCEVLAPKVVELIKIIVEKVISHRGNVSVELVGSDLIINSVIKRIFDLIGENLLQCDSKSFGKNYQHRVKFVSLIFTNFVNGSNFLRVSNLQLKENVMNVIGVALTMIQSSHDLDVTSLLLNLIIRPFSETFMENEFVISRLWGIVCNFYIVDDGFVKEEVNSTGYLILCFMADYIFDSETFSNIRNDDRIYVIIQFGLVHPDSLSRKISQFILKRAVDFCLSCQSGHITCSYFFWDDSHKLELKNVWNDFFLLLETLEEKQSHVVRPVLDKLDKFIGTTSSKLIHVAWMLTVFKRIFDHDNKSIKFWGVMKLLKLKLSEFSVANGVLSFVNSILITVLSDYSLYNREINFSQPNVKLLPSVGEEYGNFLTNMILDMDSGCVEYFMLSILENIFDGRNWGGIPLLYIMRGLSVIPSTHSWNYDIVKNALVKFEGCLSTQEVSIRSASQCAFIRAIVKHMSLETSLIQLCSIVRHFRRKESWCRGTVIWEGLIESLDKFKGEDGKSCVFQPIDSILRESLGCNISGDFSIPPEDVALAVCLHFDKSVNTDGSIDVTDSAQNFWHPVYTFLSDCHQRPYIDHQKYIWVLKLLINILEIYNDTLKNSRNKNAIGICFSQMHDHFSSVMQSFLINFGSFGTALDTEVMCLYLSLFGQLAQTTEFSQIVKCQFAEMFILCQKVMTNKSDFKIFFGITLLEFLWCHYFDESTTIIKQEITKFTIFEVLCKVEEITGRRQIEGNTNATSAAKLQLEVTRSCWTCVEYLVVKTSLWESGELLNLKQDVETKTLSILLEAIAVAGRVNVLSVFKTCTELAHIIIEEHMWQDVVELLWKSSSEFKKCCDLYRSLMQCLSDLLFHHSILAKPEYADTIEKISQNLLVAAEGVQGIANHMARSLVLSLYKVKKEGLFFITDGDCSAISYYFREGNDKPLPWEASCFWLASTALERPRACLTISPERRPCFLLTSRARSGPGACLAPRSWEESCFWLAVQPLGASDAAWRLFLRGVLLFVDVSAPRSVLALAWRLAPGRRLLLVKCSPLPRLVGRCLGGVEHAPDWRGPVLSSGVSKSSSRPKPLKRTEWGIHYQIHCVHVNLGNRAIATRAITDKIYMHSGKLANEQPDTKLVLRAEPLGLAAEMRTKVCASMAPDTLNPGAQHDGPVPEGTGEPGEDPTASSVGTPDRPNTHPHPLHPVRRGLETYNKDGDAPPLPAEKERAKLCTKLPKTPPDASNDKSLEETEGISQNLLVAAEGVQGIANHMARSLVLSLYKVKKEDLFFVTDGDCSASLIISEKVIDLYLTLARFGTVHRKQQKLIRDTITYIKSCPDLYSTSVLVELTESDQQARAVILRFFLSLDNCNQEDRALAVVVYKHLKQQYSQCIGDRRDFANSQKHRYKSRLLQVLLILLPLLCQEESCDALEWLCEGLIKNHQQPSVRYMQEWGVSLIIIHFPEFFCIFEKHLKQGTKERVGCVGSFLASLTHIACTSEDKHLLRQSIECALPWCMAQHFNTRLYAQVSLRKIWQYCEDKNITELLNQFRSVQHCLQFVAEQGNAVRNTLNMLNDFYFKVFHPLQHYTLQTIFYDLPCLSMLSDDEWLAVESLMNVMDTSVLPVKSILPLYNEDNVLAESVPAPWVVKAVGETSPVDEQEDMENLRSNVQKKMTPWKSMMPELSSSLGLPNQKFSGQRRGGLIVVASLIDKTPNLGGLCRTCEVFSVKEYVVSSLAIQEDHNFNSLSLTAQQWVPMKEVKPEDLPGYLRGLQREGYTLVAAEQTANSKLLSEYEFPERTVVILGNEREGIPCDLLQLLDVCVEIPQSGIIRSLNVHVSGALFVWEYTRQHLHKLVKQDSGTHNFKPC